MRVRKEREREWYHVWDERRDPWMKSSFFPCRLLLLSTPLSPKRILYAHSFPVWPLFFSSKSSRRESRQCFRTDIMLTGKKGSRGRRNITCCYLSRKSFRSRKETLVDGCLVSPDSSDNGSRFFSLPFREVSTFHNFTHATLDFPTAVSLALLWNVETCKTFFHDTRGKTGYTKKRRDKTWTDWL